MKKLSFIFILSILFVSVFSQSNSFPPSGNVGIGTVNPVSKLQVVNGKLIIGNPANIDDYNLLYSAGSTPGFRQEVQRGSGGAAFDFVNAYAHKTSATGNALWGKIGIYGGFGMEGVNEVPQVNYMYFGTNLNIDHSNNTFRLYPNKVAYFDGKIGIGITNPIATLDINGNLFSSGAVAIGTKDATKIGANMLAVNGAAIFTKVKVAVFSGTWPDYVFSPEYQLPKLDTLEQFLKNNGHLPEVPRSEEVEKDGIDIGNMQVILLKKVEELTLIIIELNKKVARLEEGIK